MKFCIKDYLNKLLEFSDKMEGINSKFKDKNLEENYTQSLKNSQHEKSKNLFLMIILTFPFVIGLSLYISNFVLIRSSYMLIGGMILEIILAIITHRPYENVRIIMALKYLRFTISYLIGAFVLMFPVDNYNPLNDALYLRYIYFFLLKTCLMNFYCFEFNFIFYVFLAIGNSIVIGYIQFNFNYTSYFLAPEFILNFLIQFVTFTAKKEVLIQEKKIFLNTFKNELFFKYFENLINVLNTMVISMSRNELLFMNDFACDYFDQKSNLKVSENDILFSKDNLRKSYNSSLFNSLVLKSPEDSNSSIFKEGRGFDEILSDIQDSNNIFKEENFIKIGFFMLKDEEDCFEIYFRKLKFGQVIVEFLINDVTQIKNAERINAETKYKQKILAKIAHEFKTPLISITSLINKINHHRNEILDEGVKVDLNHINNLSNYTIFLINDIIQYVSNSINLLVSKTEINLREVLNFTFNVLKTLIECNEAKLNIIQPKFLIDKNIDDLTIVSDENRLKQIILNLVSNSFKFTKTGFIKIEARCIDKEVEISVEDSGIGIREEDYHLIFQENTQLNIDHEYNSKGSGLGLSIAKNLANKLNHKINFQSQIEKGTKFNLLIECTSYNNDIICFKDTNSINTPRKVEETTNENLIKAINFLHSENIPKKSITFYQENSNDTENLLFIDPKNENLGLIKKQENDKIIKNELNESELIKNSFCFSLGNLINENSFKIVVIDDHKFVRNSVVTLIKNVLNVLQINNSQIIEGCDGIELLNIVMNDKNNQIKYIFTDENMEFLNGSEAVRILRKLENGKKIRKYPIVSITAFDDSETRNNILNSGVDSILSKPCTKNDIRKILSNLIKDSK